MGYFITNYITQLAGERIFKIGEHLAKLQAKCWLCHTPHSPYTFVLKDAELARAVASTRVQGWENEPCKPTVRLPD